MTSEAVKALGNTEGMATGYRHGGLWRDAGRRLVRNRAAMCGCAVVLLFACAGILAPVISPYNPDALDLARRLSGPTSAHWFGTDLLGRDELTRTLYGARVTLRVSVLAVLMGLVMGSSIGAIAGAFGGKVDAVLMRFVDVLLAIPGILLAIGVVTLLGQGLTQIMFAVAVATTPLFARLLRARFLELREADFVIAARTLGASRTRLLVRHMLPNALTQLITAATVTMATAIIDVAGLGFLGLGPSDPRTPEWGAMLTDSTAYLRNDPSLLIFPAAAIVAVTTGFNLLGDGLRDSLDPKLSQ